MDLVAEPGQTVAILGATGAGKSSIVNLVPRFYDVAAGRITWNGTDIRDVKQSDLLAQVSIVPQETILFSGTVRDNIRYGKPDANDDEVIASAKAAQAHDFIVNLPNGYDTRVEERGVNLSGGQKQRIAIARALLLRPSILILDDSTSSVDVETETKIQDAMKNWLHDSTCFVVAQRISTVLHADKILVVDDGKIAAQGTHGELMRSSPVYQEIYDSQLGDGVKLEGGMSNTSSGNHTNQPPVANIRAALGRGPMQPGKIEKAKDPRHALTRLALYLSPYKTTLILVLTFVLLYISLGLLEPYLIGRAIDQYISTRQTNGLSTLALLLLTAYFFDNAFQAASSWLMARISQDALRRLRRDLFEHLQKFSVKFFDNHTAGELMSRLTNDIEAINQAVSQNVISLVASVLSLVGIVVAMFVLNAWLALAALLVVPIMFWFTQFIARYTRKGFRNLQKELGEINGVMEESISGQRVVKAFRRSEYCHRTLPRQQPKSVCGGYLCQHLRPHVDAAHQCTR